MKGLAAASLLTTIVSLAACGAATAPSATPQQSPSAQASVASSAPVATAGPPSEPPGASQPVSADLPRSGRIAFTVEWGPNGDDNKNIYTIEPDGTGLLMLTHRSTGVAGGPAWTPDGTHILFGNDDPALTSGHVFSMDASGGSVTQLSFGPGWAGDPAVSPNGARIAFDLHVVENGESIYMMNADGSEITQVTATPAGVGDLRPTFSPDGRTIAFVRNGAIYLVDVDGSHVRRLTPEGDEASSGRWSPDGTRILFANRGGLQVMDADGSGQTRIADGGFPSWSPDGSRIERYTPAPDRISLVVAHADGSHPIEIWHTTATTDTFIAETAWGTAP